MVTTRSRSRASATRRSHGPAGRAPCPHPPPRSQEPTTWTSGTRAKRDCLVVVLGGKGSRLARKVQMRGGARGPHARRSLSTLSVRPRAPTKQMGLYRRPALVAGADENLYAAVTPRSRVAEVARLDSVRCHTGLNECLADGVDTTIAEVLAARVGAARIHGAVDAE